MKNLFLDEEHMVVCVDMNRTRKDGEPTEWVTVNEWYDVSRETFDALKAAGVEVRP